MKDQSCNYYQNCQLTISCEDCQDYSSNGNVDIDNCSLHCDKCHFSCMSGAHEFGASDDVCSGDCTSCYTPRPECRS